MKNVKKVLGFAIITAIVFALFLTGCDDDTPADTVIKTVVEIPPEQKTAAERWVKWVSSSANATLDYSVDDDDVCTITVGGTADSDKWKATAQYSYTAKANTRYTYVFEAWTESDDRLVSFQYYWDDDDSQELSMYNFQITNERKTYYETGKEIPKSGVRSLSFQCADQLGTFYVKVISIYDAQQPEQQTPAHRWSKGVDASSTATLDHFSVDGDGMVTITVGGVAEPEEEGNFRSWVVGVSYAYTSQVNTSYIFQFQAKTESGTRQQKVEYYSDYSSSTYFDKIFTITDEWQTYTIIGQRIPKSGVRGLTFRCADQLGTLYVKAPSITVNAGVDKTITITGIPGDTSYPSLGLYVFDDDNNMVAYKWGNISNNSVSLNLIEENGDLWLGSGSYYLYFWFDVEHGYVYTNGQPLTNGPQKYNISSATSTIAFNKFIEMVEE